MSQCVVKNCKSVFIQRGNDDQQNAKNITFHLFPKDAIKRKKWIEALGLQNVSERARICSNHFPEDAFDKISKNCIRLREHAIPNLCLEKSSKNKSNNCGTETDTFSQDDSQDLSDSESVIEDIAVHTLSDGEISFSEKEQIASPVEITRTLINPVPDISNKYQSNFFFYFGDGDVPGQAPFSKPKPEKSPRISCTPQIRPIENEPELPPCETCGTKKKRSMDRATSVSPERIFHCSDKKRIREHYENEIKRYKHKMRGLQQKVRRLEASRNRYKLFSKID